MKTFFVTGVQRSGTTLLSVMLSKHPEIHLDGFSKAFRLITCFNNFELVLPDNLQHPDEDILKWLINIDYKDLLTDFLDHENIDQYPDVKSLIEASIQKKLAENGKTVWGDKSPNLQHFISDILRLIPEAKFVHIIRDGRATAHSFSKRAYKNLYLAAQEWVDGNINALFNKALLGEDKFMTIHFEDLVKDPKMTITKVCSFLEIPFHEDLLNLDQGLSEEEKGKAYVKSKFDVAKLEDYKNHLSQKQIKKIERIQGPLLEKLGYKLSEEHQSTNFKYLSIPKRFWFNQKDNLKSLFRSKKIGMHDRKEIVSKIPFSKRAYFFLLRLGYDILPLRVYKSIFRRSFVKEKYLDKKK